MPEDPGSARQAESRKLAAIMFTDIVGFSRQMGSNEARMLRLLETHNQVVQQAVAEHHGTVIKVMGDAFLVDFPSMSLNPLLSMTVISPYLRQLVRSFNIAIEPGAKHCFNTFLSAANPTLPDKNPGDSLKVIGLISHLSIYVKAMASAIDLKIPRSRWYSSNR
jgi:hypothetical protein